MTDTEQKKTPDHAEKDSALGDDNGSGGQSSDSAAQDGEPRVVYRRAIPESESHGSGPSLSGSFSNATRAIAPAIIPLVVGFLLLLILIFVLGLLSVRRMDEVSVTVLDLEQQHAAKLGLLLKLRLAVTKLNNEARTRAEAEARGELQPPLDMRLNLAQDEVNSLRAQLEQVPLTADPTWQTFRNDLESYAEVTEDLRRYSLEGFDKFRVVDTELDKLLRQSTDEQAEVFRQTELVEQAAARSIRLWSLIALLVGAIVTAGTIREVQRRFAEMRQSMDEAKRERVFTSQLMEGMVSAVAAIDEENRIRSANAAFFKIFPQATIGASIYEKFGSEAASRMLEEATANRVDQASYRGRWVCPDEERGQQVPTFDIYASPLALNGTRGQILTLVDVTEAAEAERGLRRQESLAAVGQATAQVAHEIRNPLGSIGLGVEMLRDSVTDEQGLKTIDLVERGIMHLNKLVVDVTQFSRRKVLEQTTVDLHDLINHSLELVADRIDEKDSTIEKNLSDQKLVGHWDPDQLRQVFVNIIANALDASPKQTAIKVSTQPVSLSERNNGQKSVSKHYARTIIADRGKGMDKATLDRIFEPFFSTKKKGTGLGLAIVRQIIEQHEGKIGVESEPGEGTRFIVDLPL